MPILVNMVTLEKSIPKLSEVKCKISTIINIANKNKSK